MYVRACDVCLGSDAACTACAGRGESIRYRCPASEAGELGGLVVRALAQQQNGLLPAAGGWAQQTSKLARLVDVAAGERGRIQDAERKQQERPKGGSAPRKR